MFDFLKRQKLQRQGYSCGKKRRESTSGEWAEILRTSTYVRALILAGFLCALSFLVRYVPGNSVFLQWGSGLNTAAMLTLLPLSLAHFRLNMRAEYSRNSRFLLVYGVILLQLTLLIAVWKVA